MAKKNVTHYKRKVLQTRYDFVIISAMVMGIIRICIRV